LQIRDRAMTDTIVKRVAVERLTISHLCQGRAVFAGGLG